jgi:hypothetical protein
MFGTGAGIAVLIAGTSASGGFWTLMPGSVIWGFFGGIAFVALFASAGTGVAPKEQGIASGLATTTKEVGGAMGLAVFITIATAGLNTGSGSGTVLITSKVLDGLRTTGWAAAAVTAVGGLIALALATRSPQRQSGTTTTTMEESPHEH